MTDLAPLSPLQIRPLLERAFAEDLGDAGDITTNAVVPANARASARAVARHNGRVAGADVARTAFAMIDPDLSIHVQCGDGSAVMAGETILRVEGPARAILTGERVALNMLGHMSGIATLTAAMVAATEGHMAQIVCTRKTTPGLRAFEKFAVRAGGGVNHRFGLHDGILIKDNHIAAVGSLAAAVKAARQAAGHMVHVEVETDTLEQVREAVAAGADTIMLDNMSADQLREAVTLIAGRATTEASGGVTLETVAAIAATGVDYISSGAITHSAPALDIGLDFQTD